jgi:hypothetical protein
LERDHGIDLDFLLVDVLDETPLNQLFQVTVYVVSFYVGPFTQRRFGHPAKIFSVGKREKPQEHQTRSGRNRKLRNPFDRRNCDCFYFCWKIVPVGSLDNNGIVFHNKGGLSINDHDIYFLN